MLRFLLPAFALMAALIVLFAGALGDLHSWPNLSDKVRTIIGDVAPSPAPLPPARTVASPVAPAVAVAEPQAAHDPLRRQTADRQASELEQQNLQRSHGVEQISRAPDAGRQKAEQQPATAAAPTGSASAELQAKRDALQRQVAGLQRQSGELQQQVAQRSNDLAQSSHELDAARSDTRRLRQDIEALEQLRKTAEQQMTAAARSTPRTPGPSAAAAPEQQPAQDELRRQNADLQQQAALRSRDLDAARAESSKLRQDIDALNLL
jgi:DNA repair exonuclease SbcCD ATPase subunit